MKKALNAYRSFSAKLRDTHLLRHLPHNRHYLYDFSSNDYLGLSQHPDLIDAAIVSAQTFGVGAQSSRLITSQQGALQALERDIAHAKHTQAALIFATGYQANVSVLSALLDPRILQSPPLVFADKLNHASMHAGCQMVNVKQQRYRHLDYDHLAWMLDKAKDLKQPKFILTESVFGMDGDVADLEKLITLAKQHEATLYVDEAHATGILGEKGYGLTSDFPGEIAVSMGTFSKALGGSGAYVACSNAIKRYLVNRCGGLIFSTAPSPMQVAAMQTAWSLIPRLRTEALTLLADAATFRQQCQLLGFATGTSTTHIIPLIFKQPMQVLAAQQYLARQGIRVSAIRPPSVPPLQSRLRIALTTRHTEGDRHALLSHLKSYAAQL